MCCCMRRSHRSGCLQCSLVLLLLISLLVLTVIAAFHLTVYFLTASDQNAEIRSVRSINSGSRMFRRQVSTDEPDFTTITNKESIGDQLANALFVRNFTVNRWVVQGAIVLDQCDSGSPEYWSEPLTDIQFSNCLRQSYLHIGLATLLPLVLVTITLAAVCGLCTCPMATMAMVYIGLSVLLVLGAVMYRDGAIISAAAAIPLLVLTMILVSLYTLFALMLLLLCCLVCCCGRPSTLAKSSANTGPDHEKMMKVSEEEFEIDDPNVPLYARNGYSPQKRTDFEEKVKEFKYIDDDMSYIFRRG